MWFDVQTALAEIENQGVCTANPAIPANPPAQTVSRLAELAGIAADQPQETESPIGAEQGAEIVVLAAIRAGHGSPSMTTTVRTRRDG